MSADRDRNAAQSGCPHAGENSNPPPAPKSSATPSGAVTAEIPGPRPTLILGWRGNVARFFLDPLAQLAHLRRTYGDMVCLAQGGNGSLILAPGAELSSTIFGFGPECNQQILPDPAKPL